MLLLLLSYIEIINFILWKILHLTFNRWDDASCLRFCYAADFNLKNALEMIKGYVKYHTKEIKEPLPEEA